MNREGFRSRLKQYKKAREENPGLKYWEWKEVPKYATGTNNVDDESNTSGVKTVFTTDGNAWRKRPTQEMLDAFYSGDVKRQAQLAEQAGQTVTYTDPEYTLDEVVVTAKDLKKELQRKQEYNNLLDLGITVAGLIPSVGEFADAADAVNQFRQGNITDGFISTAATFLPFVPAGTLRRLKNKVWEFIGDKTGYYRHIPTKQNEMYRQVTQSAIDDAERVGIVRANPNSISYGQPVHYAGAAFKKGELYLPKNKDLNYVIVGNSDEVEFVPRWGHMKYDDFDIHASRTRQRGYDVLEYTPVFNEVIDNNPISLFYYYQRGDKGLSKYFWKKKKFKLDNVELNNMSDDVLDELYLHSINTNDADNTQRLRDLHFIKNAPNTIAQINGLPQTWYHGAPYGNYNKFNSSKFNATIGGLSAVGDKGNFFTTDLPSAQRYAGSAVAPFVNGKKLFDFGDGKGVLNVIDKVDPVVYPMYLNVENPLIVDFKGQPWSKSPVEVPNSYTITEHFLDDATGKYVDNVSQYLSEEDALAAFDKYDLPYTEKNVLKDKRFDDRVRSLHKWTSAPRYETVILTETLVPNTTNGIVNWASRKGNDSALMTNVIDSNGGGIDNKGYAIDDLVTFKSSQGKLKDAITYDDDGNIIKLSKRDDFTNDDIRLAEGGEVTGPPTYEEWYADATKYNPTIWDNYSMYRSMNALKDELHGKAMELPGYADKWNAYVRTLPKVDPSIDEFVDDLWVNENPDKVGYNNGKYYPHKSPESGKATIGPGFKLGSGSHKISEREAYRGVTKNRLDQEARRVGKLHLDAVNQFINYGQTTNPADTVSPQIKIGLMDLRHQVGPLNEWGKLRDAVLEGDLDKIKKESTVVWNDGGEVRVDKRRKKIRDEKYFHYAEGTDQVQPDPLEVLDRSKPRVAGIPINDRPLSGTDPIGEAMMWGLGGGAASAALRSLFPTYGATAGWLAFGDHGKENALVIPTNPIKNNTPIETGLLNKEVRQYYADDVLPRDILTSEADKLRFLNTDKYFEYDLYPQEYFSKGVAGHYDPYADKIRLNGGYTANKDLLDNVMAHEVNHRYNREFPLDKEHTRILNRAYTVEPDLDTAAARAARKPSEKRATNVNIRHKLQTELRNTLGHKPTKAEMDKFIDSLSDLELLDRLGSTSSYGSAYLMSIQDRAELSKQPADQYKKARITTLRKALKRIAMNESKNDNDQNYA